jgi:hypothetical protein
VRTFFFIVTLIQELNVGAGADGKQAAKRRAQGFDMISIGVDIDTLVAAYDEHMAHARGHASGEAGSAGGSYS